MNQYPGHRKATFQPKRETQGCDSVGDDIPCSKCGAVALDTGLECSECGHDMWPELSSKEAV